MALIHFVVHRDGEKWCVRSAGLERAFAEESAAMTAAVALAEHSAKNGKPAIVLAELPGGALETVWSHGKDHQPAPPAPVAGQG